MGITIDGPEQTDVICTAVGDNIYKLKYTPPKAGKYDVNINFSEYPIPGSPFKVQVTRGKPYASKCEATGIHQPGAFSVNAKNAGGNGLLEIGVTGSCTPCDFITVK
ncbi:filamin/ABP280 repeat domain-containing protein, partial [Salmonella sp. s51228]|uniref:filamin/ABP280 repeat domain-containing protein n=1 Tax=Salmonella sp. s51228 TaxID=3159652 RepID=UPI003980C99F